MGAMNKIWHPYTAWECWQNGMWRTVSGKDRAALLKKAVKFTGDAELYGSFMLRVIKEWPTACEQHLSGDSGNKNAWIGHAATCLAIQCPEDITRASWGYLSKRQQDEANHQADMAILQWEAQRALKN